MRIVRQTNTEIVVQDSSLWVSAICGVVFLVIFCATLTAGNYKGGLASTLLLVFTIAWLRRTTFVFDSATRTVRWKRLRIFRIASGTIPFSEIQAITIEATTSDKANVLTYRLTIVTPSGNVPMSDPYSSGHDRIEALRERLQNFFSTPGQPATAPAASAPVDDGGNVDALHTSQLNTSIRSLLQQGRKIDAILLVQGTDHLDLTEATFRVNQIDHQMKSEWTGR